MIDYYAKLVGVDHVAIATDDMFDISQVVDFATKNASLYNDGGYMIDAFNKGADDSAPLARIMACRWVSIIRLFILVPAMRSPTILLRVA